jgi:hypothetical protein
MTDEVPTAAASTEQTPPPEALAAVAVAQQQEAAPAATDGPAVEGVAAWAAAFEQAGVKANDAPTLAKNCLTDGYEQGVKATQAAMAQAPEPTPKPETLLERVEDDAIRAAEEVAYAASNLTARALGRKPYDGIADWRARTGGLTRHPHAAS